MLVIYLLYFRKLSPFFKHVQKGFPHSDMGPFLLHILVLLQASTWGPCSPQPVLYLDTPLSVTPPSDWPRPLLRQTFTCINTLAISCQLFFLFKRPMKMEQCSETSAQKIQMPGNHPKERTQDCTLHELTLSDHPHDNQCTGEYIKATSR